MKFESSMEEVEDVGEDVRDESEEEEEEMACEEASSVVGKFPCKHDTSTWSFVMTVVRLKVHCKSRAVRCPFSLG
jgi:hypothetical protein